MLTFPTFPELGSILHLKTTTIFIKGNLFTSLHRFQVSDIKTTSAGGTNHISF